MDTFQRVVIVAAGLFAFGAASADAGQKPEPAAGAPAIQAAVRSGRIAGTVTDVDGQPLDGAMVSAFGPLGAELVVSDGNGRFLLPSLAPGRYLVQAHVAGFVTSRRRLVSVRAGRAVVHAIAMSRVGPSPRAVFPTLAGLGLPLPAAEEQGPDSETGAPAARRPDAPHDHGERAWRLRRARRGVLKQTERGEGAGAAPGAAPPEDGEAALSRSEGMPASFASWLGAFPLTGEVNLLTRATLESASPLVEAPRAAGIANLSVGAPAWRGDWTAHGAMNTGDVSSWFASGAYLAQAGAHRFGAEAAYGRQRYDGVNPLALTVAAETRNAASIGGFDRWGRIAASVDRVRRALLPVRLHRRRALQPACGNHRGPRRPDCVSAWRGPRRWSRRGPRRSAPPRVRDCGSRRNRRSPPCPGTADCFRSVRGISTWGWNAIWPGASWSACGGSIRTSPTRW